MKKTAPKATETGNSETVQVKEAVSASEKKGTAGSAKERLRAQRKATRARRDMKLEMDVHSAMMEKLLRKHTMASWEDLTYGNYMKACNLAKDAEDPSRQVGTVRVGDVLFDVALSSSKEAPSMTFTPKIPSGKRGKDSQNLAPLKLPVRLEPPTTFETFQYRAERLMSKAIIDNHLSEQVFASKIFQKEKNRVQPLLR